MSVRVMALIALAALGLSVTTLNALQSPATRVGSSAGIGCAYVETSALGTVVTMVEGAGSEIPPVAPGSSCAAAYQALLGLAYRPVDDATVLEADYNDDGKVDAADYVVWRKTDGTQGTRPGTVIITRCTAFSGRVGATEISLVDHFGDVAPPLTAGMSCAAGVNALLNRGFVLLVEGPTIVADVNGDQAADSGDYNVWRTNFGAGL